MESVLGRVLVMVLVGMVGGMVAILLVKAEARRRFSGGLPEEERLLLQEASAPPPDARRVVNAASPRDAKETRADVPRGALDPLIGLGGPQAWHSPNGSIPSRTSMLMASGEVDFFDEILTVLRRRLLSHDDVERVVEEDDPGERLSFERVVRSEGDALGDGGVAGERYEKAGSRHRLRHPRKKAHHRRFDKMFPGAGQEAGGVPGAGREARGGPGPVRSTPVPDGGTKTGRPRPTPSANIRNINETGNVTGNINSITESVVSSSNPVSSVSNFVSSSDPAPDVSSIVSSRSLDARDSIERAGRGVAAEVEEAVLLAVPLSLLLTLLLLLCVACCCCYCRCRTRHDHDDQEPLTSDQHDQWTTLGLGVCEACLPDISYQVHVAKKTKNSRKRRPDQSEVVLEGDPEVTLGSDEVTCHPPLYTLLSNLPPGSSRLEDDLATLLPRRATMVDYQTPLEDDLTALLSYDSSPQHRRTYQTPLENDLVSPGSYSRPRRSHSLEFLAV